MYGLRYRQHRTVNHKLTYTGSTLLVCHWQYSNFSDVMLCFSPTHYVNNHIVVGPDSSVGTATRYGLDRPRIESRWGVIFSIPVQNCPGAHPASCTTGTGLFTGVKRLGRGVGHPPLSSVEVEERAELYLHSSSSEVSWPVLRWPANDIVTV
jgi:hypothetical protein